MLDPATLPGRLPWARHSRKADPTGTGGAGTGPCSGGHSPPGGSRCRGSLGARWPPHNPDLGPGHPRPGRLCEAAVSARASACGDAPQNLGDPVTQRLELEAVAGHTELRGQRAGAPTACCPSVPFLCLSVLVFVDLQELVTPVGGPAPPSIFLAPRPPQDTEVPLTESRRGTPPLATWVLGDLRGLTPAAGPHPDSSPSCCVTSGSGQPSLGRPPGGAASSVDELAGRAQPRWHERGPQPCHTGPPRRWAWLGLGGCNVRGQRRHSCEQRSGRTPRSPPREEAPSPDADRWGGQPRGQGTACRQSLESLPPQPAGGAGAAPRSSRSRPAAAHGFAVGFLPPDLGYFGAHFYILMHVFMEIFMVHM